MIGKTHPACALAQKACRDGYTVAYRRFSRLLDELAQARAVGARQEVSGDFTRVLESQAPCSYRIGVATEHELLREIAYLRDILGKVADDMETAAGRGVNPKRWFTARTRRIRELLDQPVPPGWSQLTSTLGRRR